MSRPRVRPLLATVLLCLACAERGYDPDTVLPPPPPPPAAPPTLTVIAGGGQSATVGQLLGILPAVKVTAAGGVGVAGLGVTFAVSSGGGTITGSPVRTTDATGTATLGGWTLGTVPGINTLTATVNGGAAVTGSPATITAIATAGGGATITILQAIEGYGGFVGGASREKPAVKVTDGLGNPVSGVSITFAVIQGGGSVTGGIQTTGADGIATVGGWTLGTAPGTNVVRATAAGTLAGNPINFTANALTGPPAIFTKVAGDNQTAVPGSAVLIGPRVKITDQYGNKVANRGVNFTIASGDGYVTTTPGTTIEVGQTDAEGEVSVSRWVLGGNAGANTLLASVTGNVFPGNSQLFSATGVVPTIRAPR